MSREINGSSALIFVKNISFVTRMNDYENEGYYWEPYFELY